MGGLRNLTALGKTVLLTTHYLDEAEELADRVAVIASGRILEVSTPRELGGRAAALARVSCALAGALAAAPRPALAGEVSARDGVLEVVTASPTAVVQALAAWAGAHGLDEVPQLAVARPTLEEIYLGMIARNDGAAVAAEGAGS